MSTSNAVRQTVDKAKIGDCAAMQPLSGINSVDQSSAVNGLGRGGVVSKEEDEKTKTKKSPHCH